ncbi:MAG TPA: ceramidase domain-containing protein [Polyangiaceae bacterium]|nr:ceramidase domain-containing protein [Polyangiaceae bacterium]
MPPGAWLTAPASCLPDRCFCEHVGATWPRQPANTWSSLAFLAVAVWVLFEPRRALPRGLQLSYALCLVALGISSCVFHATLSFVGQWSDVTSMYAFASLLLAVQLPLCGLVAARHRTLTFVLPTLASALLAAFVPASRRVLFDILLGLALLTLVVLAQGKWRQVERGALRVALGLLVVAGAVWVADLRHLWCEPSSLLQGHAVWHLLTAAAAGSTFSYYRRGFSSTEIA